MIGILFAPNLTDPFNTRLVNSPTNRPNAAPILSTGMKTPDGTAFQINKNKNKFILEFHISY